jgi:Tfp pilus assembly protein PilX
MVLPIVLLISTMMLVTSAAWFETSLAAARGTTNVRDYLQAFHAADSALTLCARSVIAAASAQSGAQPVSRHIGSSQPHSKQAPLRRWRNGPARCARRNV